MLISPFLNPSSKLKGMFVGTSDLPHYKVLDLLDLLLAISMVTYRFSSLIWSSFPQNIISVADKSSVQTFFVGQI